MKSKTIVAIKKILPSTIISIKKKKKMMTFNNVYLDIS